MVPTINTANSPGVSLPNNYDNNGEPSSNFISGEPVSLYDRNTYQAEFPDQNVGQPTVTDYNKQTMQDLSAGKENNANPVTGGLIGASVGGAAGAGLGSMTPGINRKGAIGAGMIIGGLAGAGRELRKMTTNQTPQDLNLGQQTPTYQDKVAQKLAFYREDLELMTKQSANLMGLAARYSAPLAGAALGGIVGNRINDNPDNTDVATGIGAAAGMFLGGRSGLRRAFNTNVLNNVVRTGRTTGGAKPLASQSWNKTPQPSPLTQKPASATPPQAPQPQQIQQTSQSGTTNPASNFRMRMNSLGAKVKGMFAGPSKNEDNIPVIRSIPLPKKPNPTSNTNAASPYRINHPSIAPKQQGSPSVAVSPI